MNRRTIVLAPAVLALMACAGGSAAPLSREERRDLRIGAFQVVTSGAVFDGAGAQEVRNLLPSDLEGALRGEFADRRASGGWVMQAEIARLRVVGGTATATGRGQSELSGSLRLIDGAGALRASVPLTVTAGTERESLAGTLVGSVTGSRGRFYRAMLAQFARDGREVLLGRDLPGERLVRRARTAAG